jgi:hypothetical protein
MKFRKNMIASASHWIVRIPCRLAWAAMFILIGSGSVLRAGLDSGGGISQIGEFLSNHSSTGSPYATQTTQAGPYFLHLGEIQILFSDFAPSDGDGDGNGLPDQWESDQLNGVGADPMADADGDGMNNLFEFLAGTDPLDGSSVFRPAIRQENGDMALSVPTVAGRRYRLWGSSNLSSWSEQETIPGDGSIIEWVRAMDDPGGRYFLRIEILNP